MILEMEVNTESFTRALVGYSRAVREAAYEATVECMAHIVGKIRDRVESSSPAGKWWVIKGYPGHKYSPPGARASAPGQPPAVITGELLESLTYNVRFSPGQVWVLGSIEAGVIYARILEYGGMAGWGYIAPRPYVEPVIYNRMVLQECSNIFSEELKSAGFGKYVISKGKKVTTRPTKKV